MSYHILLCAALLLSASEAYSQTSQWQWSKQLSVSVKTDWDASHVDDKGNFYFVGTSEKFAGNTPARAIVVSKWNSDTTRQWSKNFIGGHSTTNSFVGTDAGGNVFAIAKFSGLLTRPDGTTMEHPQSLEAYVVSKFDMDGNSLWSRKLTLSTVSHMSVLPNGSIGIVGVNNNGSKEFTYGDSTVASFFFANQFLEISGDGGLRHSVYSQQFLAGAEGRFPHMHWAAPGKLRVMSIEGNFAPLPVVYGEIDLATAAFTRLDTLFLSGSTAPDLNLTSSIYDPASGHLFSIVKAGNSDIIFNETDTLYAESNGIRKEGYVVELDESMQVVRKLRVTNPEMLAVRDTQVALTAVLNTTVGFISDELTVPPLSNIGHVVYVMDREFKHRRNASMRSANSGVFVENSLIDSKGGVYLHVESNYDIIFDQRLFDAPSHSDASIVVLGKVGDGFAASVPNVDDIDQQLAVYPNPASSVIHLKLDGPTSYRLLDVLGRVISSGITDGRIDISNVLPGNYFLSLDANGGAFSTPVRISR